jgi:uncharacterized protein (DUF2267 family)
MQMQELMGQIQNKAKLPYISAALNATRATLEALQQAVSPGEIGDIIERLPADYLRLFGGTEGRMRDA